MTDIIEHQPLPDVHTSDAARERLRKRYASEARFKYMGLAAVLVAASFLALLIYNMVLQGVPAFTQHNISLDVDLSEEVLELDGARDRDSIRDVNFDRVVRNAIRAEFPYVEDRRSRRMLNGLTTTASGIILRDMVVDDPNLVGGVRTISLPASDFADLYFKDQITDTAVIEPASGASPTDTTGTIRILSRSNDFAPILAEAKEELRRVASKRRSEAAGLQRSLARVEANLERERNALSSAAAADRTLIEQRIAQRENEVISLTNQIASFISQAEILDARAAAADEEEQIDSTLPSYLVRINGGVVKVTSVRSTEIAGRVIVPLEMTDEAPASEWTIERLNTPEAARKITDDEIVWLRKLEEAGKVEEGFATIFFSRGASREAEMAGIWGAVVGSFWTMVVTLLLSFPVGVAAAIYLEEFAPRNRFTDLIEVNINNLAAVPSIVFGLLGLAVFLNVFGLPRSAPLAGGMVLALMTLPTIIIASRAALRAVPPSIREAALGMGASRVQTVFHHVLPLAMPGILTGTIIGMAQALGETAPLLMIGMVAFIVDIPGGPLDAATVLPVQIYMWADFPEPAFQQKTAAAIMVLLGFLVTMNALAVILRKRFERRW